MSFDEFFLQSNNGKKININELKELKKSDLKNNSALIRIFNIFDTQNADGTKGSDGILNKEELNSLFNAMSNAAKLKGNATIFDEEEAQNYINSTRNSEGLTLNELGIKTSDLFNFMDKLTTNATSTVTGFSQSFTREEIENLSLQTMTDDFHQAREMFDSQNNGQGVVSDFVNGAKEEFDTEFAASRVNRYLMREELSVKLLAQSKSKTGLTKKDYLEQKIELAIKMLPKLEDASFKSSMVKNMLSLGLYSGFGNKTEAEQERITQEMEIELLSEALRKLKPEDLTSFIERITSLPDDEYLEITTQLAEDLISMSLEERINSCQTKLDDSNQVRFKNKTNTESIEYIIQNEVYRQMSFEETFLEERGVIYNSRNIMDYTEKNAKMQFLLGMHNKRQEIYNILHNATITVDGNNKYGAPDQRAIRPAEEQLESAIIQALTNLYGGNPETQQAALVKLGFTNLKIQGNKLVFDYGENNKQNNSFNINHECSGYELVEIANKLQSMVDANYQAALGGKTLEEYSEEVSDAYENAYGTNIQDMAKSFVQSQQEGVQTVKTVIQTGAMVVMIAGQLVPVAGQAATAMTIGGLATTTFGSVGVSALENYTKTGGPTEDEKKEMLKELGISLALVSSGMGIGKTSEAAFRALVLKNCPKLLAFASEVGIDATMSLVADYAITGQIDLSGEGIAQLQAILVGLVHAKGNFRTYLNTHAGDLATKPQFDQPTIKIDTSDSKKFINLLSNIKDADGKPKFTEIDIQKILDILPKDIGFTNKDIFTLMSLPDITADTAISILSKIDNIDKLNLLKALTDDNTFISKWFNFNGNGGKYDKLNSLEIENIFVNIQNSNVPGIASFYKDVVNRQYWTYFNSTPSHFMQELTNCITSEKKVRAFHNIMNKYKVGSLSCTDLIRLLNASDIEYKNRSYEVNPHIMDLHKRIKDEVLGHSGLSEELATKLAWVDDETVLEYILSKGKSAGRENTDALLSAVIEYDGSAYFPYNSYSCIGLLRDENQLERFIRLIINKEHIEYEKLLEYDIPRTISDHNVLGIPLDIEMQARFQHLREYIGKNPNDVMSQHLYNNYYLKGLKELGFDDRIINELQAIDKQFGVKIMIGSDTSNIDEALKYVKDELDTWQRASQGKATMPPYIDFNSAQSDWYDVTSAYGQGVADAYSWNFYGKSLSFSEQQTYCVARSMRHELTHSNDLKRGENIDPKYDLNKIMPKKEITKPDGTKVMVPDMKNCMYIDEFIKIGISEGHISYAYNNTKEFIAVASEGDLSKCSPEFKQMLIDFGMPEWRFYFDK